jgi:translation initiation factor 2 alpha subunit (eIF-2alpha)
MSPSEIRRVMQKLQSDFGGSYTLYEIPQAASDDFGALAVQEERDQELAELKRLADESAQSNWVFVLGGVVVVLIIGVFIYLAAAGPLKAPPTPVATPSATTPATHQ